MGNRRVASPGSVPDCGGGAAGGGGAECCTVAWGLGGAKLGAYPGGPGAPGTTSGRAVGVEGGRGSTGSGTGGGGSGTGGVAANRPVFQPESAAGVAGAMPKRRVRLSSSCASFEPGGGSVASATFWE